MEILNTSCAHRYLKFLRMMMMMMMMMINQFCGMVDRKKTLSFISSWDYCQRFSPSQISHTPGAWFEPAQNLSSYFVEWSCTVVIASLWNKNCSGNGNVETLIWWLCACVCPRKSQSHVVDRKDEPQNHSFSVFWERGEMAEENKQKTYVLLLK